MQITAESVTAWHPDKICDQVADAILDECLKQDDRSRVAVEVLGGHNYIYLVGEITTKATIDYEKIAKKVYFDLTGKRIKAVSRIVSQCPEIAQGVDIGGAGDQGIMIGYACNENDAKLPQELYLSRKLLAPFKIDGKSQVTIKEDKITDIVLSVQGKTQRELSQYVTRFIQQENVFLGNGMMGKVNIYCNNTGSFEIGGFDADSGCTGRKIVIDQYGPRVPVGGGSFSGKDATKVDRSGAYMARWIALNQLKKGGKEALVKLAYVIGKAEPVMVIAKIDDIEYDISKEYDCRPLSIIERFGLRNPIYLNLARNGHFGVKNYPWEQV